MAMGIRAGSLRGSLASLGGYAGYPRDWDEGRSIRPLRTPFHLFGHERPSNVVRAVSPRLSIYIGYLEIID